ncbi:MAG: bifunctional DNA primase/polymerase [Streptosporangiaceae bacterium]|nr:bifunctional DNA primase/polymerase [Streptosporangiaceae bacterium]
MVDVTRPRALSGRAAAYPTRALRQALSGHGRAAERHQALGAAAAQYALFGWPVCAGAHPYRGGRGSAEPGRACSCDRVGCPAPGAHPASPAWQLQATADLSVIQGWWRSQPQANVILVTGRVFDVLDVPAAAGESALDRMDRAGVTVGPTAALGDDRMLFFVMTRGAPADEHEWWTCGLDCEPESVTSGLRWHCRDSYVLAPPSTSGAGLAVRWLRGLGDHQLPDALRLLEHLVDACEARQ